MIAVHPERPADVAQIRRVSEFGLAPQWPGVPDEAFMVLVLDPAAMPGVTGEARYRDEFDAAAEPQ